MKKILLTALIALIAGSALAAGITLNGAGASFPYPLYSKWAYLYEQKTRVKLNYQSIGSGGGIAQIKAKTVDFGASDAPLKKEELDAAGLAQFPMTMGGVVPVINLAGIPAGTLKLSGPVLADIFLGKITSWDDPAIVKLNPGVKIPKRKIVVVHRADGSGTTWIFTSYLAKVSPEWAKSVGNDKAVSWPTGIAGKGNEGVAAYVKQVPGAIGYVEYAYAIENKINYAALQNKSGKFVKPTIDTFQAAAANADWSSAPAFYMVLTDQPGDNSWPITGASFILIYKQQADAARAKEMLKFFDWCMKNGAATAKGLHYVPLPANVITLVQAMWTKDITAGGKPLWP